MTKRKIKRIVKKIIGRSVRNNFDLLSSGVLNLVKMQQLRYIVAVESHPNCEEWLKHLSCKNFGTIEKITELLFRIMKKTASLKRHGQEAL